jgi:arginyl-tRNA synthetase
MIDTAQKFAEDLGKLDSYSAEEKTKLLMLVVL